MKKEYLVSAEKMQRYDRNTIDKIGIPACVLMERAAYAVAMEVKKCLRNKEDATVLVLAGNGNNGADGVCAGRILAEYGIKVRICLVTSKDNYVTELQRQLDIAACYDIPVLRAVPDSVQEYDLVIDALFGNGLNREIQAEAKKTIHKINDSGCVVVSVDIPSGIDATTGKILGCAVKADVTVTFGFYKIGLFRYPGRNYCGKIVKAKIAINETGFFGDIPDWFAYLPEEPMIAEGQRDPMGNKGTFGKVLVVAGRDSTTGAAVLCASSALRSGCGMVGVFTDKRNKETFLNILPEAIVETYSLRETAEEMQKKLKKQIEWADVIVTGCGLLQDEIAYSMLKQILNEKEKPIVCDADALQMIAKNEELLLLIGQREGALIFTPHPGELAALAGCNINKIKEERMKVIRQVLEKYPVILVAKDADTLVCANGQNTYLNVSGNDGLATAGSGDVLAGLIASMIAQKVRSDRQRSTEDESAMYAGVFEAVCKSVYFHGYAADVVVRESAKSFLVASDLIQAYKHILS